MQFDLVFEGGGAKGVAFVGAIEEFEARRHTARRFLGTSAGAITATLMAAGYSSSEMLNAVNERLPSGKIRFSSFMDIPEKFDPEAISNSLTYALFKKVDIPWIPERIETKIDEAVLNQLMKMDVYRELFSFVERGGMYAGVKFMEWIKEKLNAKIQGLGEATLSQFNKITGRDLSVIASDTEGQEMLVLNHRTAPDCPVAWAVRMSMSVPFIWQEVSWDKRWGFYAGRDITGHTIVDGGVLSNFPIHLLSSKDEDVTALMGDTDPNAVPNLGLLIDEKMTVEGAPEEGKFPANEIQAKLTEDILRLKTVQRIRRLVDTLTNAHDRFTIERHGKEVCRLPANGYGTSEFDMSDNRLNAIISAGKKAMKEHLDARGL